VTDPVTLSVLAGSVLTPAIEFLYAQAGELLKRRRERKEGNPERTDPVAVPATVELAGELGPLRPDDARLSELEPQLRELRNALVDYAEDPALIKPDDMGLLATADALRRVLEAVYQQRITFRGEQRPLSGPAVDGTIDVRAVTGYVAAVRVNTISGPTRLRGAVRADEVSGTAVGLDIDRLG
jgi:hypothetical protein